MRRTLDGLRRSGGGYQRLLLLVIRATWGWGLDALADLGLALLS
jgi:hypothetical protein